jgi:tetratricopeptide (TPR) repeat protein
MSLFGRLFGSARAEDERKKADALFAEGRFYDAKTAYEEASAARDATDAMKKECAARVVACSDALAEARIAEAEKLLARGDLVHGRAELENAIEVAASDALKKKAKKRLEGAEQRDARVQAKEADAIGDDERILLLAAQWEEAQQDEYDAYGEPFRAALVAMDKGENQAARDALEAIASEHREDDPPPVYLYLELARARSRSGDDEAGAKALRTFLKRVPEDDRSDARMAAYGFLAQIAEREGDEEKAIKQLNKAVEAMPDDPRPYLNLGVYLRAKGHPQEAIDVLNLAIDAMDEDRPSWEAYQELGLAHRDVGDTAKSIDLLEKVLRHFMQRGVTDFPASAAVPLAQMHEKAGNDARAADLYSALARGSNKASHFEYHVAAARCLERMGLEEEARRMATRAEGLVGGDAERKKVLAALQAELDGADEGEDEGDDDDDE